MAVFMYLFVRIVYIVLSTVSVKVHSFSLKYYLGFRGVASQTANQDTIFLYKCQNKKAEQSQMEN